MTERLCVEADAHRTGDLTAVLTTWAEAFGRDDDLELHLLLPGVTVDDAVAAVLSAAGSTDLAGTAPIDVHVERPSDVSPVRLGSKHGLEIAARWIAANAARLEFSRRAQRPAPAAPMIDADVLFVSHDASRSGAPMVLLSLVRWLKDHTGLRPTIAFRNGGPLVEDFARLGQVFAAAEIDERLAARFDLVWSNTVSNGGVLGPCFEAGTLVVIHAHELDHVFRVLGADAVAASVRRASHVVAASASVATALQSLVGHGIPPVTVTSEIVDDQRLARIGAGSFPQAGPWGPDPQSFVAGWVGTLEWRKGADAFVRLAAELARRPARRQVELVWIGNPSSGLETLYDLERIGPTVPVHIVPEVADPLPLMARFDALAVTSREDPWPVAMLEGALASTPMVCFERSGGPAEFSAPGCGIAVGYLDVAAMADALMMLEGNAGLARAIGEAGRARVLAESTTDRVASTCAGVITAALRPSHAVR